MGDNNAKDQIIKEEVDGGFISGPIVGPEEKVMEHLKSPVKDINARYYNMNHDNRGVAVIFNHRKFDSPLLRERVGTDRDCEKLNSCFKELEFKVKIFEDLRVSQLLDKIREIAKMDHSNSDCLVIAILSHGEDNGFIQARDGAYKIDQITGLLTSCRCPTLAGKPKIIIIEACQGSKNDTGVEIKFETDGLQCSNVYRVPMNADFLIVNSSIPGYCSFRHRENGTWFIQAIVAELEQNCYKDDLITLLTFANNRLALESHPDGYKQIACITSMLTRIIKFSPKKSIYGSLRESIRKKKGIMDIIRSVTSSKKKSA